MVQIIKHRGYGTIAAEGVNALLADKIRRMEQKRQEEIQYSKNLNLLQGLGIPNSGMLAHSEPALLAQLFKAGVIGQPQQGAEYGQEIGQLLSGQEPTGKLPQQLESPITADHFTPEAMQQIEQYVQTPEAQQKYTPEQLDKIGQMLQMGEGLRQHLGQEFPQPGQQLPPQLQPEVPEEVIEPEIQARTVEEPKKIGQEELARKLSQLAKAKYGPKGPSQSQMPEAYDWLNAKKEELLSEKKQVGEKQQKQIEARNKPYLDKLITRKEPAESVARTIKEMREIPVDELNTGYSYRFTPYESLSSASKDYDTHANSLANAVNEGQRGAPTIGRRKAIEAEKPRLNQDDESRYNAEQLALNKVIPTLLEYDIYQYVLNENGGNQPANIDHEIEKIYKKIYPAHKKYKPDPTWEEGEIIPDDKGIIWRVADGILRFEGFEPGKGK